MTRRRSGVLPSPTVPRKGVSGGLSSNLDPYLDPVSLSQCLPFRKRNRTVLVVLDSSHKGDRPQQNEDKSGPKRVGSVPGIGVVRGRQKIQGGVRGRI